MRISDLYAKSEPPIAMINRTVRYIVCGNFEFELTCVRLEIAVIVNLNIYSSNQGRGSLSYIAIAKYAISFKHIP